MVSDSPDRYVLRIYTFDWRTKTEVSEELRLLMYLSQHSMPVSHPIADREGGYIQEINAPEGMRYAVLFSFADGKKIPKFGTAQSFQIGITMAKLHKLTEDFHLDRIVYNPQTLVQDSLNKTQSFFSFTSDEMTFVKTLTDHIAGEFEKVNTAAIRNGAVHLDMWFDNMHFNGESELTIFDFDFCGNGWQCLDIGYFLCQLYATNADETEYRSKAEKFFEGYESITRISEEEKRILPLAGLSVFLFYLGVQCERFDTWSNIFLNEDHLKRFTGSLKRWIMFNNLGVNW
jgi:Ser/Thr protein kinase RdoA (MazF antagonist)